MNGRSFSFGGSGNPLTQILSLLVLGVLLIGAVIMGAFVLMFVVGLAVIAAVVFSVRVWWLRRKLRREGRGPFDDGSQGPPGEGRLIEGEYVIIEKTESRSSRRDSE